MANNPPDSYFWAGNGSALMGKEFFQALSKVEPEFAKRLKRAVKVAGKHDLGVVLTLKNIDDLSSVQTEFISKIDQSLAVDEAIILAVEMFDIFHNNPHIIQIPIQLPHGRRVYLATAAVGQEADSAIIVLNKNGEYLTSYDQTRNEFFPVKLKISKKQQAQLEGVLAATFESLYDKLKENISTIRTKMEKEKTEC